MLNPQYPLSENLTSSVLPLSVILNECDELVLPEPLIFNLAIVDVGAPIFNRLFVLSHAKLDEAANDPAGVELN
jgi:hypothetical protein